MCIKKHVLIKNVYKWAKHEFATTSLRQKDSKVGSTVSKKKVLLTSFNQGPLMCCHGNIMWLWKSTIGVRLLKLFQALQHWWKMCVQPCRKRNLIWSHFIRVSWSGYELFSWPSYIYKLLSVMYIFVIYNVP